VVAIVTLFGFKEDEEDPQAASFRLGCPLSIVLRPATICGRQWKRAGSLLQFPTRLTGPVVFGFQFTVYSFQDQNQNCLSDLCAAAPFSLNAFPAPRKAPFVSPPATWTCKHFNFD